MVTKKNKPDENQGENEESSRDASSVPRRLAEWISLGVSVVLILATASYLVVQGLRGQSAFVPVTVTVLKNEVSTRESQFILPIEVSNQGEQTIRAFTGEVSIPLTENETESHEFTIDYLGVRAREKVYVYFDQDPRGRDVKAKPLTYQVE